MNIVILLGAPGSGKGTVAGKLAAENANLKHVSSGDLLRGAVANGTPAGVEAKGYMESGKLVPDALIAQMIKDVVAETTGDVTMLLDGFPRNLAQAQVLADMGAPVTSAVLIDVPDEIIQDRIAGRRTCPTCKAGYHVKNLPPKVEGVCDVCGAALTIRKDDNPETVKDRLVVYHQQTEPLIAFYKEKGLLKTVVGTDPIDTVAANFLAVMQERGAMKVDIKSKAEIDRMREACRMSAEIRDICAAAVAPGLTTGEIDDLVVDYCRKHNVKASFYKYAGFPGHLCVSINDEVIHGIPSRHRVIMPGDLVKTDVGILKNGFNGDTSRTVMLGVTDPDTVRLVETTKACLKAGIAACGPGVHLGDVGYAIQQVAEAAGFGVVRDWIGHGVGRTVHEDPQVPNYGVPGTKLVLRPGMTIAIEPMITMTKAGEKTLVLEDDWTVVTRDRCLSAHFEHTVAITDDGCEVLTLPADYP